MVKAVMFDVVGTLVDSVDSHAYTGGVQVCRPRVRL
jgi:beta-phosphoglucomutase-like phosphatase (HAD superfamily)